MSSQEAHKTSQNYKLPLDWNESILYKYENHNRING